MHRRAEVFVCYSPSDPPDGGLEPEHEKDQAAEEGEPEEDEHPRLSPQPLEPEAEDAHLTPPARQEEPATTFPDPPGAEDDRPTILQSRREEFPPPPAAIESPEPEPAEPSPPAPRPTAEGQDPPAFPDLASIEQQPAEELPKFTSTILIGRDIPRPPELSQVAACVSSRLEIVDPEAKEEVKVDEHGNAHFIYPALRQETLAGEVPPHIMLSPDGQQLIHRNPALLEQLHTGDIDPTGPPFTTDRSRIYSISLPTGSAEEGKETAEYAVKYSFPRFHEEEPALEHASGIQAMRLMQRAQAEQPVPNLRYAPPEIATPDITVARLIDNGYSVDTFLNPYRNEWGPEHHLSEEQIEMLQRMKDKKSPEQKEFLDATSRTVHEASTQLQQWVDRVIAEDSELQQFHFSAADTEIRRQGVISIERIHKVHERFQSDPSYRNSREFTSDVLDSITVVELADGYIILSDEAAESFAASSTTSEVPAPPEPPPSLPAIVPENPLSRYAAGVAGVPLQRIIDDMGTKSSILTRKIADSGLTVDYSIKVGAKQQHIQVLQADTDQGEMWRMQAFVSHGVVTYHLHTEDRMTNTVAHDLNSGKFVEETLHVAREKMDIQGIGLNYARGSDEYHRVAEQLLVHNGDKKAALLATPFGQTVSAHGFTKVELVGAERAYFTKPPLVDLKPSKGVVGRILERARGRRSP